MNRTLRAFVALALCALPLSAMAQALSPDEATAIDAAVTDTLARTKVPGVSIAVVRDGKLVERLILRRMDRLPDDLVNRA